MYDNRKLGEMPKIEYYKSGSTDMVRLPYEVVEVSPGIFSWRELSIRYFDLNYGGIVSALIGLKYSPSEMTAIINNYLLDAEDTDANAEFTEMQDYRKYVKTVAKQILADNKF